ncbi:hypothetical protein [Flavobacterium sp.]|uniref:hypothetical protein n=1 Tax=Flavobacterium sp. TaxID=239 RepID=UPI0039E36C1F
MKNWFSFLSKDELCGQWSTDDGSGFSMIMGSAIHFKPDGTGTYQSWGGNEDDDTGYDFSGEFTWKRTGKKEIEITKIPDGKPETVRYKLTKWHNLTELSNSESHPIGHTTIEGFWDFYQTLFK